MKSEKDEMIIREDNICPMKNIPCDDECCSVGAICNLYASILIGSTNVDEQKKTLQSEDNAAFNAVKSKFTKPESTQEGGTVEGVRQAITNIIFDSGNTVNKPLVESLYEYMTEYASQVSATDKKRIGELEKEVERLRGLVETAYSSAYNRGYMDCRDKVINNEPPFDQFKQDNNL